MDEASQELPSRLVERFVTARDRDIGAFSVKRLLPAIGRRTVGPFVFLDHMGPAELAPGAGMDVRPHPHIGLATLTYLFAGAIAHRDSLGSHLVIRPGEVNWMVAGRGIVHSERSPPLERTTGGPVHGLQFWVALPQALAECAPAFFHHRADELPHLHQHGADITVVAGDAWGKRSPVPVASATLLCDIRLAAGATLPLCTEHAERAVYVIDGTVELVDGTERTRVPAGTFAVLRDGATPKGQLHAPEGAAHVMLVGGAPLDGPRHLWWNFVASSKERLEQAKADWREGRFPPVPGEHEFIPLPPD